MLGIPGMFATATEWWAIEICSLNAGLLSETSLAAQTIVQTGIHMWISTYYGVSVAASNRIGVFLGARDPARAKTTAVTAFLLSLAITLLNSSLVLIFLYLYSPFLASDIHPTPHPISPPDPSARVTTLVATLIPFAAVFHIFDGIATTAGAILRGCGRHRLAAGANLVAYYVVGIPVGLGLAFAGGWDVVGLWVGLGMGVGVAAVWMGRYVYGMDWEAEVEKVAAGTAVVGFGHG
ncbi:mate-domain-containing protein [Cladochytrium replicatum]|nr:mate-domain-containing protein [Cladochytrium replicatum]